MERPGRRSYLIRAIPAPGGMSRIGAVEALARLALDLGLELGDARVPAVKLVLPHLEANKQSVHHAQAVQDAAPALAGWDVHFYFLPPYSPDFQVGANSRRPDQALKLGCEYRSGLPEDSPGFFHGPTRSHDHRDGREFFAKPLDKMTEARGRLA